MLKQILIKDFALFSEVQLNFEKGLTVLVGETGAGKSILIDALNVALGGRSSADVVRAGAKKAILEVVFDASKRSSLAQMFSDSDLDWDDEEIIIRREITSTGGSRSFVNDTPVQQAFVRQIGVILFDFHGQHDTSRLFLSSGQRFILDEYAGCQTMLDEMASSWTSYQLATKQHQEMLGSVLVAKEEISKLEFLLKEIDEVSPQLGEDVQLLTELNQIEHSEVIVSNANEIHSTLSSGNTNVLAQLQNTRKLLSELSELRPELLGFIPDLDSAEISLNEIVLAISDFLEVADYSAAYVENLRLRLASLQRLVRKHGSIEATIQLADSSRERIQQLTNIEESIEAADKHRKETFNNCMSIAADLRKIRQSASIVLQTQVTKIIKELGMPTAEFEIRMLDSELQISGLDKIEFMLAANKGEDAKPLNKTASGGELSRVMLALKSASANKSDPSTMVFDEIDTGVSGKVARQVGKLMQELAKTHQIMAITHLAQIASLADQVIRVQKIETKDRTEVLVGYVTKSEAELEIAKLLSGAEVTDLTILSARELINTK